MRSVAKARDWEAERGASELRARGQTRAGGPRGGRPQWPLLCPRPGPRRRLGGPPGPWVH